MKITKFEFSKNYSDNKHGSLEIIMVDLKAEDVSEIYKLIDECAEYVNEKREEK